MAHLIRGLHPACVWNTCSTCPSYIFNVICVTCYKTTTVTHKNLVWHKLFLPDNYNDVKHTFQSENKIYDNILNPNTIPQIPKVQYVQMINKNPIEL